MYSNLKYRYKNINLVYGIAFLTLLISLKSSNPWSDFPIGNEFFWWIVQFIFIFILIKLKKNYSTSLTEKKLLFVKLYIFWNVICITRGVFVAENYWEWKTLLATSFFLLLPLIVYLANSLLSLQIIVKTWFKYALFVFVLISPFLWGDGVGKFLIPFSFLLLFFPILNFKWKIIALLVTIFVLCFDITARSNIIKFVIPLLIGLLFYLRKILSSKILNTTRFLLLFIPFVLLFLAVTDVFNIFKLQDYVGEYNTKSESHVGGSGEESLIADSRTFLYLEVIESALRNEYVFFGRTPARGNDSVTFGDYNKETLNTGKQERFSNEVSILNVFTWLGIVGVILYFLIFIKASYLAINQSNNIFIKLIGLNVAFRWAYGWVEDFSNFDLSNIFLWIMIGMCFSESFRKMSDREFKMWVQGIFQSNKRLPKKMAYNAIINKNN
jgi:hypothetical protein